MVDYNENNPMSYSARAEAATVDQGLRSYMLGVYNYMCSALALTGITAYLAANWQPLRDSLYTVNAHGQMGFSGLGLLFVFAPLAFVLVMNFGINRLSLPALQGTFWAYAGVMGLSLSSLLLAYTGESVVRMFFVTAIVFGSMSIWGYTTKRDLTGFGHFLYMGLLGILVAMFASIFFHSSGLQFMISVMCVIVFTGLTAFKTQMLKAIYYQTMGDAVAMGKSSVMGALSLYLSFINLFITLLQLFGNRR